MSNNSHQTLEVTPLTDAMQIQQQQQQQQQQSPPINTIISCSKLKIKNINELQHEYQQKIDNNSISSSNNNTPNSSSCSSSKSVHLLNTSNRVASVPGKPRGATYDGNVCMICSDRASGFHYGVLACEGCKGFFKRVCKEKVAKADDPVESLDAAAAAGASASNRNDSNNKRHCIFGGNCEINVRTRNRCQYCRIQKCIELGMSKDGIKLGRRSKRFKQNLTSTVSNTSTSTSNSNAATTKTSITTPSTTSNNSNNKTNNNNNDINTASIHLESVNDLNNNITNKSQQQPIIAIFQDNKLIFKAIDILTAAASASASSSSTDQLILANNTNILNSEPACLSQTNSVTSNEALEQNVDSLSINKANLINNMNLNGNFINLMIQQQQQQQQQQQYITSNSNQIISAAQNNVIVMEPSQFTQSSPSSNSNTDNNNNSNTSIYYSKLDAVQLKNIIDAIIQAHKETLIACTALDLVDPSSSSFHKSLSDLASLNFGNNPELKQLFGQGLLFILNESKFLDHFNNLIENAVLFAKNVPYFMDIHETDRIALLKSCVFEIICVRHASCYYHRESNNRNTEGDERAATDLATLAACAVAASTGESSTTRPTTDMFMVPVFGTWTTCEWLCEQLPQLRGFIVMLADFFRHFSFMELDETECAIFCSFLLFNTVDPTLNDSEKLNNYRGLFNNILIKELEKKRCKKQSDIDLNENSSSTNTLKKHSFQSIHAWLNGCCKKLKDLNNEHANVLLEYKQFVQFPDLYAELYNL